jgi:hypothetical protein
LGNEACEPESQIDSGAEGQKLDNLLVPGGAPAVSHGEVPRRSSGCFHDSKVLEDAPYHAGCNRVGRRREDDSWKKMSNGPSEFSNERRKT